MEVLVGGTVGDARGLHLKPARPRVPQLPRFLGFQEILGSDGATFFGLKPIQTSLGHRKLLTLRGALSGQGSPVLFVSGSPVLEQGLAPLGIHEGLWHRIHSSMPASSSPETQQAFGEGRARGVTCLARWAGCVPCPPWLAPGPLAWEGKATGFGRGLGSWPAWVTSACDGFI